MAIGTKLLKKLTLRTFIGTKSDILAYALQGRKDKMPEGEAVPIMQVLGNVNGYKADESDYGSYVELRGDFHATNLQTGEVMESVNKCILPSVVGELVAQALKNNGGAEAVKFAVEIDVRFSEKAATMYEFDARSLVKPQVAAPIADMIATMKAQGIAMTAPKQLAAPVLSEADKKAQEIASAAADAARDAAKAKAAKDKKAA